MATRKRKAKLLALLDEMLVDAHGDSEQIWALLNGVEETLVLPIEAHVVGQPVSLVSINYDSDLRCGIMGCCRLEDGRQYRIALADVELPVDAPGYDHFAAYCGWLGVEPVAPAKTKPKRATKAAKREDKYDKLELSKPVELIILAVKRNAVRCRLLSNHSVITLRASWSKPLVPGQIATVKPKKHWRHSGHPYLSGDIVSVRLDATALGLTPLELTEEGDWDPAQHYWGEDDDAVEAWAQPIIERGPRPLFEMQQVLPGSEPGDFDSDAILVANDLMASGDFTGAQALLHKMVEGDLRCLDAHAQLGNIEFERSVHWALAHYEVGIRIGELSLGDDFDGVLAWGLLDNRPFLRCMLGYGLCLWRLKRWQEAEQVFDRMLWMNPTDNSGVRFLLPDVHARKAWADILRDGNLSFG